VPEEQDWRLMAELEEPEDHHGLLDRVLDRVHDEYGKAAEEARAVVAQDVAVTHDGHRVFAYAGSEVALASAREGIAAACRHHELTATYVVSHWDDDLDRWRQVDPPESAEQAERARAQDLEGETVETQTVVCSAGGTVRASLEQGMREYADRLGLECEVVEHPHLLQTQVAFNVTGTRHRIAEFRAALEQDSWTSIRADGFGTGLI
jgi:hypothetical protein